MTTLKRFVAASAACVLAWTLTPGVAAACEMCWGAGVDTPTTRGISMAMFSLIGVVGVVGGGIGAFFYHTQRRAHMLERSDVVVTEYGDIVRVEDHAS